MDEQELREIIVDWAYHVSSELEKGNTIDDLRNEFDNRGFPEAVTALIISTGEELRKRDIAADNAEKRDYGYLGLAMIVLGAIVTAGSYYMAGPGGTYTIAVGMFLVGAWYVLKAS
jgi:hypothetical protein